MILRILLVMSLLYANNLFATPGVIVVSGGGPEGAPDGQEDSENDWSYQLYKQLINNGSIHNNNQIKVVVVSLDVPDTPYIANYFKGMGATSAVNITIDSKAAANDPKKVGALADADVVFFRGGNQGKAYEYWKGTLLQKYVKDIADHGGAIGGTSSGAMSLPEFSMTGGFDYDSPDVLRDSHSHLLNDKNHKKESGIHNDFLNLIPGTIVDTHCAQRARVGRLLSVHAKASEDYNKKDIVGICVEEKTGIAISNGKAKVFGTGAVHFIQQTDDTKSIRIPGKPLIYTDIEDNVLTEDWVFDLNSRKVVQDSAPSVAEKILKSENCGGVLKNTKISAKKDAKQVEYSIDHKKTTLALSTNKNASIKNTIAVFDAHSEYFRSANHTTATRTLYDLPNASLIMLPLSTHIETDKSTDELIIKHDASLKNDKEISTLIYDCSQCTQKSLATRVSSQDSGSNTLHSAGFVGIRIHAIPEGYKYNVRTHLVRKVESPESKMQTCDNKPTPILGDESKSILPVVKQIEICNP